MKDYLLLLIALTIAVTAGLIFGLWLLGSERLNVLALILISALAAALVLAASSLPIRAWRKRDATGETTHYHHDGRTREIVRVIDNRPPAWPQLPSPPPAQQFGVFPELLRAAYTAGQLPWPTTNDDQPDEPAT